MIEALVVVLLVSLAFAIYRVISGPSVYGRILAVNSIGTKTVLLIAALGFVSGRPDFLDLALVYALMNFIGTIAALRFTRERDDLTETVMGEEL